MRRWFCRPGIYDLMLSSGWVLQHRHVKYCCAIEKRAVILCNEWVLAEDNNYPIFSQDNGDNSHRIAPSPVVHVRGLCESVVEADLVEALEKFGNIWWVVIVHCCFNQTPCCSPQTFHGWFTLLKVCTLNMKTLQLPTLFILLTYSITSVKSDIA